MSAIKKIIPEKQKRLKVAIVAMIVNYLLFLYGISEGADLSDLGNGLAMTNVPLMVWILGETYRPTKSINENNNNINEQN